MMRAPNSLYIVSMRPFNVKDQEKETQQLMKGHGTCNLMYVSNVSYRGKVSHAI